MIKDLHKRHRTASLEYMSPNEYRKWMSVAGRMLPRVVTPASAVHEYIPQHSYERPYSSDVVDGLRHE